MVDCSSIGGVIILRVDQIDGLRTVDEFRFDISLWSRIHGGIISMIVELVEYF